MIKAQRIIEMRETRPGAYEPDMRTWKVPPWLLTVWEFAQETFWVYAVAALFVIIGEAIFLH